MPEPLVASGGFCVPPDPLYDFFMLRVIPGAPEALLKLWRRDMSLLVEPPEKLPSWLHPVKRYAAKIELRIEDERRNALENAINELEICLSGGGKPTTISDILPAFEAQREKIAFYRVAGGES